MQEKPDTTRGVHATDKEMCRTEIVSRDPKPYDGPESRADAIRDLRAWGMEIEQPISKHTDATIRRWWIMAMKNSSKPPRSLNISNAALPPRRQTWDKKRRRYV